MASAVQSLRLCLRTLSRQAPIPRNTAPRICISPRPFSSTPMQWRPAAGKDEIDELVDDEDMNDDDGGADAAEMERVLRGMGRGRDSELENVTQMNERILNDAGEVTSAALRAPKLNRSRSFWNEDEDDTDLITDEMDEDEFDEDDIMSMAHGKLEEFREYREFARIAAWQMPLLSKLARPFEAPTAQEPLRFRYTSYMGEFHPAEKKVVVEFSPRDMPLNEAQQLKLKKLLGPRFNPETEIAKMSCEQFEHQAQNKRYLGDLVDSLVAQAKDSSDMFDDVPLDTRHHKFKVKPKFPKEWRLTEERKKLIEDTRQKSLLLDQAKEEEGKLINGTEKIELFFNPPAPELKVPEYVKARTLQQQPPKLDRFARR
ncbi:Uu.00g101030.m01.CDS01 [Anthostomella pinea]|uniref:Uu.00g101030.m01.CDS01 n=1 Tax=Anthostomella pinea TaxID=933095 RepID=A0AAI8VD68_9PEZI|nr:Uu.00g101030.m01.CDS01 [Anthostomella pinea]